MPRDETFNVMPGDETFNAMPGDETLNFTSKDETFNVMPGDETKAKRFSAMKALFWRVQNML